MREDGTNHEALGRVVPSSATKARRRARVDPDPAFLALARQPARMLVFLDFDGVLHPSKGERGAFCQLGELAACADRLEAQGIGVSFVISSSWRRFAPLEEILGALEDACPGFSSRVEGATGCRPEDPLGARRLEIYDYLRSRPGGAPRAFAAVDDRLDLFGGEALRPSWLLLVDAARCFDARCSERLLALCPALLALAEPQGGAPAPGARPSA